LPRRTPKTRTAGVGFRRFVRLISLMWVRVLARLKRSERIAVITKLLADNPGKLFALSYFAEKCRAAKSTISEDVAVIKETFERMGFGDIRTVSGAAGGVRYVPQQPDEEMRHTVKELCRLLATPERVLPGGFLYMTDVVFSPKWAARIGGIFATVFRDAQADRVVTVETKGIPLALMTARAMNLPLVIVRRSERVTEGSSVSMHYLSGSSDRIQTMWLPRRALAEGAKVVVVDDFMRGGGTMRGIRDLMNECGVQVVGMAVLMETSQPRAKLVEDCISLLVLEEIDTRSKSVRVRPSPWLIDS